jgi:hypothetical protein
MGGVSRDPTQATIGVAEHPLAFARFDQDRPRAVGDHGADGRAQAPWRHVKTVATPLSVPIPAIVPSESDRVRGLEAPTRSVR